MGGGPAGCFFCYFLLEMASRIGLDLNVDVYEPKTYAQAGPAGCNMCGGVISESLVQYLGAEGIVLRSDVVQRGIDSYVLHMDVGSVRFPTPGQEKRIAAVHRGLGPRGLLTHRWASFDGYLLDLAESRGARVIHERVDSIDWVAGKPRVSTKSGQQEVYDLLAAAVGVNGAGIKLFEGLGVGYLPPKTTKTYICEFPLGEEVIEKHFGNSMHVFLLDVPRLEFAAIIPKGQHVTIVLLGDSIDKTLVTNFLDSPEVRRCFPANFVIPEEHCRCFPSINIKGSPRPYGDRLVFIGDCGENRLYKDGIGGGYRAAKAAARTAVFEGVSSDSFRRYYAPTCRAMAVDNAIGKVVFMVTGLFKKFTWARRGMMRMVAVEQYSGTAKRRMSDVLWDTFTGSASYRSVFQRTLHPLFLVLLVWNCLAALRHAGPVHREEEDSMKLGELGRIYRSGETIVRQGEVGDHMYVIQSGKVEVVRESDTGQVKLAELEEGDFFGEMALFDRDVRSATVRPLGEARVLTIDKKMFLRKIHEDPSLAFRVMEKMSRRIRELDEQVTGLFTPSA
ncbi:MAG: hypothetical protein A2133_06020 [Actinobacteria bacterium RBG_16_64_13]|nr:MAG: hypothetical protein A2133_06020 [Actinobacteria bacterium RBG_16_64_13]